MVELNLSDLFMKPVREKSWDPATDSSTAVATRVVSIYSASSVSAVSDSSVSASASASVCSSKAGEDNQKKRKQKSCTSAHQSSLNTMLHVYKKLWDYEPAREFILFPIGITQLPSNEKRKEKEQYKLLKERIEDTIKNSRAADLAPFTPLLVYKFLHSGNGWTSGTPPKNLHKSYVKTLTQAIIACTQAGIVFMDLRPANVMWKANDDMTVTIKLIDFEHVYTVGYAIDSALVTAHANDKFHRYNVATYDKKNKHYFASAKTNLFAVSQITDYLCEFVNHDDDDKVYTFGKYCKSLWEVQMYAPAG